MTDRTDATTVTVAERPASLGELVADAIVHAIAFFAGLIAVTVLMVEVVRRGDVAEAVALAIYATGLLALFGFSAAYNLAPHSPAKRLLRAFDHSAIFLMIAGTYTPLLIQLESRLLAGILGAIVWTGALAGIVMKIVLPHRFERLSLVAYVGLGWVIVVALEPLAAALPPIAFALVIIGGLIYTAGIVFHLWDSLKFQSAIWHGFVAVAAGCQFAAIALSLTQSA
jgi:hemolysin III